MRGNIFAQCINYETGPFFVRTLPLQICKARNCHQHKHIFRPRRDYINGDSADGDNYLIFTR